MESVGSLSGHFQEWIQLGRGPDKQTPAGLWVLAEQAVTCLQWKEIESLDASTNADGT